MASAQNSFEYREPVVKQISLKRERDSLAIKSSDYDFLENSSSTNKVRIIERINYISGLAGCGNETSFANCELSSLEECQLEDLERKVTQLGIKKLIQRSPRGINA